MSVMPPKAEVASWSRLLPSWAKPGSQNTRQFCSFGAATRHYKWSISPLSALRLRLSFLPVPDPDPDHDEANTNDYWQKCADRNAVPNLSAAPEGFMIGEGPGGRGQDHAGDDHQPAATDNLGRQGGS